MKSQFKDLSQFLTTERPLKMKKNIFLITLKALFFRKIFKFYSDFFGYVGERLDKKVN